MCHSSAALAKRAKTACLKLVFNDSSFQKELCIEKKIAQNMSVSLLFKKGERSIHLWKYHGSCRGLWKYASGTRRCLMFGKWQQRIFAKHKDHGMSLNGCVWLLWRPSIIMNKFVPSRAQQPTPRDLLTFSFVLSIYTSPRSCHLTLLCKPKEIKLNHRCGCRDQSLNFWWGRGCIYIIISHWCVYYLEFK